MRQVFRLFVGSVLASLCLLSDAAGAQTISAFSTGITPNSGPMGITTGPDGNLWFTEANTITGNRIGRITPLGVVTGFSVGISPNASPQGITAGADGNLWFTEPGVDRIGRITPLGIVTEFSAGITAGATPLGITAGPDGNLWFTEFYGDRIGRITPGGVVTEFSAGISGDAHPWGIAAGPDGNLWFTESLGSRIGRITPGGVVTEFSAGIGFGAQLQEITAGYDGNLWFTEISGNRIGRITPLGVVTEFSAGISAGAGPYGITAGVDGNLWFTEMLSNRIGRITYAGVVSEFSPDVGFGGGSFWAITAGPDGNLWFAANSHVIGQITTGIHLPALPVIEYYHAGFDHYFITPVAAEIAMLDARVPPFQEWSRTGYSFNVYTPATAPTGSIAVCRFFNDHYAPKSSHFYAPHGYGCEATLAMFPDWQLEDDKLFNAMLPDATSGACATGTIPVYRLYNNGMGNAPNHRFVISRAERQRMLDQGWVAEGAGIGVGMCVPR